MSTTSQTDFETKLMHRSNSKTDFETQLENRLSSHPIKSTHDHWTDRKISIRNAGVTSTVRKSITKRLGINIISIVIGALFFLTLAAWVEFFRACCTGVMEEDEEDDERYLHAQRKFFSTLVVTLIVVFIIILIWTWYLQSYLKKK